MSTQPLWPLHTLIVTGLILIFTGHTILTTEWLNDLGPSGFIIGASCVAIGLICSLPTKIYLTILLMRREQ
ncbi:hypothetical protein [Pseudoalteromonas piscicida]|uniref:Uncharacterized protein n=1 Tax=Pseudoalteromonas piscicida TaxID=43662 RepID=A0AAD0REQ2_PSEO7|nr:hypothetical protein [Pseudoalteromonas piscicida]ASD65846.1 hypothetical protein B1L02_01480 [Pseudoalteromonas piscicida]AXQ96599.1 hypothetical protein D0N37_01485 [Pseudoalteromonas piscicida]AXR00885.1 hypothetical protein D0511_01490 [Pseudoalteromonas piscicida]